MKKGGNEEEGGGGKASGSGALPTSVLILDNWVQKEWHMRELSFKLISHCDHRSF